MNLKIENNNNVYELRGALVKLNVHLFQNKFQNIFDTQNDLTINIVDLEKIDNFGVHAIGKLHNEAILKQKRLSIIGSGNQNLFNHFKAVETSEIKNKTSEHITKTGFKDYLNYFRAVKKLYCQ
ncbi:STAS domain-containing protein [Flavobacteriaceae bacterium LMO-SS05]